MKHYKSETRNIQNILFSSFLYITTGILILTMLMLACMQYSILHATITNDISRTCTSIGDDIDLQLTQMDTICLNTINSTAVKNSFATLTSDEILTPYEQLQYQDTLSNTLTSLKGVDSSIRQINLYSMNSYGYGAGNYTGTLSLTASEQPWYQYARSENGHRYVSVSENTLLSHSAGTAPDRKYFSLYRMYYDAFNHPAGFVEVMKYYDIIFASADSPASDYTINVTVYDSEGHQIYPFPEKGQKYFNYYAPLNAGKTLKNNRIYNDVKNQTEYIYSCNLDYSNFMVVISIKNSDFFLPIVRNLLWIPLFAIVFFFIFYFLSKIISKKLASPLSQMYHFLVTINPNGQFKEIQMADSGIIEIDKLRDSLNTAMRSQKSATQSMLLLKEQELQARMLAFQAQMNPHFLYNSLNTISAMAEEGMNLEISEMCQDITSILRYISSDKKTVSTIEEELEHCDLYLECIKLRFKDSLTYEFDIDDDLLGFQIPKLCIQPLIENSVKFTSHTQPPWHIQVNGFLDEERWIICIKDNGTGFDEKVSQRLRSQMEDVLTFNILPSLELDGMGLLNIFMRLYLTFGNSFIFDFGNLPEGGAFVIVGGHFNKHFEENKDS